jgi:molybdopterin synthase sulfur carrier subunit
MRMEVNVLFFGITKDLVGKQQLIMDISTPITVAEFKEVLQDNFPKISGLNSVAIAVNSEYADDSMMIEANDEIALIPPVSGG